MWSTTCPIAQREMNIMNSFKASCSGWVMLATQPNQILISKRLLNRLWLRMGSSLKVMKSSLMMAIFWTCSELKPNKMNMTLLGQQSSCSMVLLIPLIAGSCTSLILLQHSNCLEQAMMFGLETREASSTAWATKLSTGRRMRSTGSFRSRRWANLMRLLKLTTLEIIPSWIKLAISATHKAPLRCSTPWL